MVKTSEQEKLSGIKRALYYGTGVNSPEDMTIVGQYAPSSRASKYTRQTQIERQGEIDKFTVIVGEFSTCLSVIDQSSGQKISKDIKVQKISKEIIELNNTIYQLDPLTLYITSPKKQDTYSFEDDMRCAPR